MTAGDIAIWAFTAALLVRAAVSFWTTHRRVRMLADDLAERRALNDEWQDQIGQLVELKRCMDAGEPISDDLWLAVNRIKAD